MESRWPIITLTTDFGTADGYVGAMKGVLLSICPQACLVDIAHAVHPQDLYHAAFCLLNATPFFPAGTVHLVVIDPGVGTARRALALQVDGMIYVGPDNGVFSLVIGEKPVEMAVALENPVYHRLAGAASHTFHGRDLFAPAAAHLAAGVSLAELGPPVTDWVSLPFPTPTLRPPHELVGEVLYLDHFGNAITSLGVLKWREHELEQSPLNSGAASLILPREAVISCRGHTLNLCQTYGEVDPGTPLALIGSSGFLEIAIRDGSAGDGLGIRPGDAVVWTSQSDHPFIMVE